MQKQFHPVNEGLKALLNTPQSIVILSHVNADGDAIGSCLALYQYFLKKKHTVSVILPNDFPDFLKWMKGHEDIIQYKTQQEKAVPLLRGASLLVCADFNELDRLMGVKNHLSEITAKRFLIDHHLNPPVDYDYTYITDQTSSTAELVYRFIHDMNDMDLLDTAMAECIFTGIMTDTGCFSYNSSLPETYETVAHLLRTGIDKDRIFDLVYNNYSASRMRLMGYVLNEKMKVIPEWHLAYITLSKAELERYHFVPGDTEGFVNLPFSIKGIHVCGLLMERNEFIKVSLRSHGEFAVHSLCEKYFHGGGHKNAAGGEIAMPLEEAEKYFLQIMKEHEHELARLI